MGNGSSANPKRGRRGQRHPQEVQLTSQTPNQPSLLSIPATPSSVTSNSGRNKRGEVVVSASSPLGSQTKGMVASPRHTSSSSIFSCCSKAGDTYEGSREGPVDSSSSNRRYGGGDPKDSSNSMRSPLGNSAVIGVPAIHSSAVLHSAEGHPGGSNFALIGEHSGYLSEAGSASTPVQYISGIERLKFSPSLQAGQSIAAGNQVAFTLPNGDTIQAIVTSVAHSTPPPEQNRHQEQKAKYMPQPSSELLNARLADPPTPPPPPEAAASGQQRDDPRLWSLPSYHHHGNSAAHSVSTHTHSASASVSVRHHMLQLQIAEPAQSQANTSSVPHPLLATLDMGGPPRPFHMFAPAESEIQSVDNSSYTMPDSQPSDPNHNAQAQYRQHSALLQIQQHQLHHQQQQQQQQQHQQHQFLLLQQQQPSPFVQPVNFFFNNAPPTIASNISPPPYMQPASNYQPTLRSTLSAQYLGLADSVTAGSFNRANLEGSSPPGWRGRQRGRGASLSSLQSSQSHNNIIGNSTNSYHRLPTSLEQVPLAASIEQGLVGSGSCFGGSPLAQPQHPVYQLTQSVTNSPTVAETPAQHGIHRVQRNPSIAGLSKDRSGGNYSPAVQAFIDNVPKGVPLGPSLRPLKQKPGTGLLGEGGAEEQVKNYSFSSANVDSPSKRQAERGTAKPNRLDTSKVKASTPPPDQPLSGDVYSIPATQMAASLQSQSSGALVPTTDFSLA